MSNKRKHNSEITKDIKLITIKPPTKEQMKITRRKNSVVETTPDKNQRRITSMFGTAQKVVKVGNNPKQSEVNTEKNSGVSEPKLKRSRNSDYARVSDMGNDISKNNPDLGESEKQLIPNKKTWNRN